MAPALPWLPALGKPIQLLSAIQLLRLLPVLHRTALRQAMLALLPLAHLMHMVLLTLLALVPSKHLASLALLVLTLPMHLASQAILALLVLLGLPPSLSLPVLHHRQ